MTAESNARTEMADTLVLGLGNILFGDEGIGCRVAEYLYATREYPPEVVIADGGTMGQALLGAVMDVSSLLLIDCGDFGLKPGETMLRINKGIPMWLGIAKMSPHQGSFSEVLALAELKNRLPKKIALLAIQPEKLGFGEKLSRTLKDKLPLYASMAEGILAEWGMEASLRQKPEYLSCASVALQNYES